MRLALAPAGRHRIFSDALRGVGRCGAGRGSEIAAELARRATIRPEGFALLSPGRIGPAALRSLDPDHRRRALSAEPGSNHRAGRATEARRRWPACASCRQAGCGDGMLIVREEAAIAAPVPASHGAIWDSRFRRGRPSRVPTARRSASWEPTRRGSEAVPSCRRRSCERCPPSGLAKFWPRCRIWVMSVGQMTCRMTLCSPRRKPAAGPGFVAAA